MEQNFREALDKALKTTGLSLRQVAIAAGVSYEQLKSLRQGKAQTTNVIDAIKVAHVFGVSVEDFLAGRLHPDATSNMIPILGRVGAGAEVLVEGQEAPIGEVALPEQLRGRGEVAAVLVEGDSMAPFAPPGSVLFYVRYGAEGVPSEAEGEICVCEDLEGRVWVKEVRRGSEPGLWHLIALNPRAETRHDVPLRWAGPVLMVLRPELVEVKEPSRGGAEK